ncbi:MAG: RDD family protein [Actinobacteria bacterium]|nr:RDD family protein [Actinomycetota bacterium]
MPVTMPAAPAAAPAAPAAAPAVPAAPAVRYAGFWRRFVAAVIDGLIVAPLWILLSGLYEFASAMTLERMVFSPDGVGLVRTLNVLSAGRWLLFALVVFGYFVLAEASSRGASLGKRLMRLRVARHDHGRTGIGRSMARTAFKAISAAPMMIGFLLAGWNSQKRALHDFMSGCVVVRV